MPRVKISLALGFAMFCLISVLFLEMNYKMNRERIVQLPCSTGASNLNPAVYRDASASVKQFKTPGVVYECLSRKPLHKYDAESMAKLSKPIQMTESAGEDPKARQDSFKEIFDKQTWGGKETGVQDKMNEEFKASGPGSDLKMTVGCVALLHSVIEQLKVALNKDVISIADIPCGDLQWMGHFLKTRSDIQYTGIDIVPTLIERHTNTYKTNPNINFRHIDIVNSPLNQSFDVIFSRQMMQHLKNSDVMRTLTHFSQSGSKYMIATTYSELHGNKELGSTSSIRFRTLNLEKPPYNLVPPVCTYNEPILRDNFLAMWELPLNTTQN